MVQNIPGMGEVGRFILGLADNSNNTVLLKQLFSEGVYPKLKFLESSSADSKWAHRYGFDKLLSWFLYRWSLELLSLNSQRSCFYKYVGFQIPPR